MSRCEWNPRQDLPATAPPSLGDCPNEVAVVVGATGQWHLCEQCAAMEAKLDQARSESRLQKDRNRNLREEVVRLNAEIARLMEQCQPEPEHQATDQESDAEAEQSQGRSCWWCRLCPMRPMRQMTGVPCPKCPVPLTRAWAAFASNFDAFASFLPAFASNFDALPSSNERKKCELLDTSDEHKTRPNDCVNSLPCGSACDFGVFARAGRGPDVHRTCDNHVLWHQSRITSGPEGDWQDVPDVYADLLYARTRTTFNTQKFYILCFVGSGLYVLYVLLLRSKPQYKRSRWAGRVNNHVRPTSCHKAIRTKPHNQQQTRSTGGPSTDFRFPKQAGRIQKFTPEFGGWS